jgi:quercetin dioxygenase-like cupin family protein
MSSQPVVVHEHDREWQSWPPEQVAERGDVRWKTLISAGLTRSDSLTLGVARLSPGETLRAHRHEQAEAYLVLDGAGVVTIDGSAHAVGPGAGVFIAGNAVHSVESTGQTELRVAYVLAADAFEDVEYVFRRIAVRDGLSVRPTRAVAPPRPAAVRDCDFYAWERAGVARRRVPQCATSNTQRQQRGVSSLPRCGTRDPRLIEFPLCPVSRKVAPRSLQRSARDRAYAVAGVRTARPAG